MSIAEISFDKLFVDMPGPKEVSKSESRKVVNTRRFFLLSRFRRHIFVISSIFPRPRILPYHRVCERRLPVDTMSGTPEMMRVYQPRAPYTQQTLDPRHVQPRRVFQPAAETYTYVLEHRGIVRDDFERKDSLRPSATVELAKVSDVCAQIQHHFTGMFVVVATPAAVDVKN